MIRLRRTKPLILAFTGAVLLVVGALTAADVLWLRERAIRVAENRASNLSNALSEYVRGSFVGADSALRQLVVYGQRIGGSHAPASDWLPILHAARAAFKESGSFSVTDADGIIRHSTLPAIVGQSRADNYLFKHLRDHDVESSVLDVPFLSPVVENTMVLPIGRRLTTPDGRFDGLVVVVLTPDAFRTFFRTINLGPGGAIWVIHPQGYILAREPSDKNPLGDKALDHPLLVAAGKTNGTGLFEGPLQHGGPPLINAYRTLSEPPILVAVSIGKDHALADWREQRRNAVLQFLGLTAVFAGLVTFLFRQISERSRVEQALADVQRTESERLREANEQLALALGGERQARQESEAASRLKDEFLMTLSHELRTPLNAIVGWVRILMTGALPDDQRARALLTVERNAQAQAKLIEDLLDVSRAITGKLTLQMEVVNAADAVLAATETLRPAMDAKRLTFDAHVDGTLLPILADVDRLQQIVWNLLSNAIKFTPAGGRVELRVGAAPNGIEIAVRDSGAGIDPAFLPFVFDRFRQADASIRREQGGLGLGLAIARHLVELHGGTISAASDGPGRGSTFRIVLPAAGSAALA